MKQQQTHKSLFESVVWHAASLVIVVALPSHLWTSRPFWLLPQDFYIQVVLTGFAYVLAATCSIVLSRSRYTSIWIIAVLSAGLFGIAATVLLLDADRSFSKPLFGLSLILAIPLIGGERLKHLARTDRLVALSIAVAISFVILTAGLRQDINRSKNRQADGLVHTAYHPVDIHYYDNLIPEPQRHPGGSIVRLDEQYMAVTGSGAFYQIRTPSASGDPVADRLPIDSPSNLAAFDAAVSPNILREYFRVIDLIAQRASSSWELYATHHFWKESESCIVLRVSKIVLGRDLQPDSAGQGLWETVFETQPCLTLADKSLGKAFSGHESGGRMAWLEVDKLLLTVGDMEHDGWYQPIAVAQDDSYLYGKTLTVDVQTGRSEIYTKGHRNPQGLLIDRDGQIWSTEHGPEGGDELNLLTRGKNFGWPYETFGTEYGSYDWPLAGQYSGNDELQEPIFSWVPSIGVSSLIQVTEGQFDRWYGDLLITTLKDRHLYRLEISHGRVLNVEPIKIGRRIRDLIESPTGGYWLWGENGDLVSLSISDSLSRGALLFKSCAACHSTGVLSGGLGPTLLQVVDRDIGGLDDYEDYSPALQAISGVWTEERLDEFLADPQAFVPGTTMIYPGIDDSDERGAIIEYLRNIEQ